MGGGMWGRRLLLLIEGSVWVKRRMVLVVRVKEKAGYGSKTSGCCFAHWLSSLDGLGNTK